MIVIRCQQDTFRKILIISFPELLCQHIKTFYCYVLNIGADTMHEVKLPINFTRKEYHIIHHVKWMPFFVCRFTLITGTEIFADNSLLGTKEFTKLRIGNLGSNNAFLLKMLQIGRKCQSPYGTIPIISGIGEIIDAFYFHNSRVLHALTLIIKIRSYQRNRMPLYYSQRSFQTAVAYS